MDLVLVRRLHVDQDVRITAEITTDATPEQFESLRDEVGRRCPVSVLFTRAGVKITNEWTRVAA